MTFKEYIESFNQMKKERIWDKAVSLSRDTSKKPVDIWLQLVVELYEEFKEKGDK